MTHRNVALLLTIWLGACGTRQTVNSHGSSGDACSDYAAVRVATVSLSDFRFEPPCVLTSVGSSLTFMNDDPNPNVIVSDTDQPESFESDIIPDGGVFVHVFAVVGTYHLTSRYYPMRATVIVESNAVNAPAASP